jgi:hypothetical protein
MIRLMVLLALLACPLVGVAGDACNALVPSGLKAVLLSRFAGYRLPRESDNLPEDIKYNREHAGSGCLGVETADFDGDGRADYLVAMTSNDGRGAVVTVAMARGATWRIYKLDVWKDDRLRLYVSSGPAGTYDDVGETDGPLEKGAEEHLTCSHPVAVFGATESTGVAYCFKNGNWKHVWISD